MLDIEKRENFNKQSIYEFEKKHDEKLNVHAMSVYQNEVIRSILNIHTINVVP